MNHYYSDQYELVSARKTSFNIAAVKILHNENESAISTFHDLP